MPSGSGPSSRALGRAVEEAAGVLGNGGVVVAPTDTLYGIMASAHDAEAVARVFRIKGRSADTPLPLLLADVADLERYAAHLSDVGRALASAFFPGPLTLVVPGRGNLPAVVTARRDTVAVRVPDHYVPRELSRRLGHAITGTSANRTGMPPASSAAEVREQLGARIDYVVDGGRAPGGVESTVLDVSGERPRLIRAGAVTKAAIEQACGVAVAESGE
jgi:L-threonylcarbamoyladenylate synthase